MQRRHLLGHPQLAITISRLCQELIENHQNFENTVIIGLQPKGIFLAERIRKRLEEFTKANFDNRSLRLFRKLSIWMGDKTADQCRNHHKKRMGGSKDP